MTTPAQNSRRRTTEQERGDEAWQYIKAVKKGGSQGENYQKEYRSLARSLNAMVQVNGLGQTLAFLHAKGNKRKDGNPVDNEHRALFGHLSQWVGKRMGQGTSMNLLEWLVSEASTDEYRRATVECLAFGSWLRRFAEAELESGD